VKNHKDFITQLINEKELYEKIIFKDGYFHLSVYLMFFHQHNYYMKENIIKKHKKFVQKRYPQLLSDATENLLTLEILKDLFDNFSYDFLTDSLFEKFRLYNMNGSINYEYCGCTSLNIHNLNHKKKLYFFY